LNSYIAGVGFGRWRLRITAREEMGHSSTSNGDDDASFPLHKVQTLNFGGSGSILIFKACCSGFKLSN